MRKRYFKSLDGGKGGKVVPKTTLVLTILAFSILSFYTVSTSSQNVLLLAEVSKLEKDIKEANSVSSKRAAVIEEKNTFISEKEAEIEEQNILIASKEEELKKATQLQKKQKLMLQRLKLN